MVEDDPLLREHVVELLSESDGLEVVGQAGSGAETLSKLSTLKPDIVLMDLGLPDMTGQEVTRQLTRREGSPLVMAHTVFDDRDNVLEAIKAGASGYAKSSGRGVKNMRSSAEELGGSLVVTGEPVRQLTVSLPL